MTQNNNIPVLTLVRTTSNEKKITYRIKSTSVLDEDFDSQLEKLMNQELVYGDSNYY